jgi:hypothetical protein
MKMLINLNKIAWGDSLKIQNFTESEKENNEKLKNLGKLSLGYNEWI